MPYNTILCEEDIDINAAAIWTSRVPNKIKLFAWLLFRGRLNTKANLAHKPIVTSSQCPRFNHCCEDTSHLFIQCPLSDRISQKLGCPPPNNIQDLWDVPPPNGVEPHAWPFILFAILGRFGRHATPRPSTKTTFTPPRCDILLMIMTYGHTASSRPLIRRLFSCDGFSCPHMQTCLCNYCNIANDFATL